MNEQEKLLIAKVNDAVRISSIRNIPKFVGFLSPAQAALISQNFAFVSGSAFFGGYNGAERQIFGVLPDYLNNEVSSFPIKALEFCFNSAYTLTHRDILGTLMSTGVERSVIGDIVILNDKAYAFVLDEMAEYFAFQIDKIKNVGVKIKIIDDLSTLNIENIQKSVPLSFTVSSARLDAVVSGLTGKSRSESEQLISNGFVFVNSFEVTKTTKKILKGDIITVRKIGKFKVSETGNFSKKGREIITALKYI